MKNPGKTRTCEENGGVSRPPRMSRWLLRSAALVVPLAAGAVLGWSFAPGQHVSSKRAAVNRAMHSLALPFIANRGQLDPRVAYYASTPGGTTFVTRRGTLVVNLPPRAENAGRGLQTPGAGKGWTLVEQPQTDSGTRLQSKGEGRSGTHVSIFQGKDPSRWRSDISSFAKVEVGEPWPGVTLSYRATGAGVERIFTLAPGARVADIRMRLRGARALSLSGGALVAETGPGEVKLSRPVAYQVIGGTRHSVAASYTTEGPSYGFRLGAYDPKFPVVIDPLIRTTYLGGSLYDEAYALIFGRDGSIYVASTTSSPNFPGTAGGAQSQQLGPGDAFVARLSPDLKHLIQATFLGGSGMDIGNGLALAPHMNVIYLAGETTSDDFPGTASGAQPTYGGDRDAFLAMLSPDLTKLYRSTYFGGGGGDRAWTMTVAPQNGAVYIVGITSSLDLPGTLTGGQPIYGGGSSDGFIAAFSPKLEHLIRASYIGGSDTDTGFGVAFAPGYGIYVSGGTSSADMPATMGAAQPVYAGDGDSYIAGFSFDLKRLRRVTYFGGSADDASRGLMWDPLTHLLYSTGITYSTDLPDVAGGAQSTSGGGADAFVAAVTPSLSAVQQATYVGGNGSDSSRTSIIVSPYNDQIYIAGQTYSTNFPATAGALQAQCADDGGKDCNRGDSFIAELSPDLKQLIQATYLGGSLHEGAHALAIKPRTGYLYVAFGTGSPDLRNVRDAAQPTYGGGVHDGAVSVMTSDLKKHLQ